MLASLNAFVVGLLFGVGLAVSGMTSPNKVVGFLDLFGDWDVSLMFVMVGAIFVHLISYRIIMKKSRPILAESFQIPTATLLDKKLLAGSVLFGIGWGLGGYCPGPAIVSFSTFSSDVVWFVASMVGGMVVYQLLLARKS